MGAFSLQSQLAELNTGLPPAASVLFLFSEIQHTGLKKHENEIQVHVDSTRCYQLGTKGSFFKIK